jgi:uncharacterized membrane protein
MSNIAQIKRRIRLYPVIALLLLSALTASIGQVAFKKGMSLIGIVVVEYNISFFVTITKALFTPYVFSGLLFYALSTMLWLIALSRCSLNFAYPFTAITFVLVILLSVVILKEPIPISRVLGMAIIIGGIFIVSLK